jgi:hypothetical protein
METGLHEMAPGVYGVLTPSRFRRTIRDLARSAASAALLLFLVYCVSVAWDVLTDLGTVKLIDVRKAFEVVTVRDAILCVVGYRIAKDVLRALVARRQPQR